MPGTANTPNEKVRELQRKLCVCAKRSRTRRFHALHDRIYRSDVLWGAWRRVRATVEQPESMHPLYMECCRSDLATRRRNSSFPSRPVFKRFVMGNNEIELFLERMRFGEEQQIERGLQFALGSKTAIGV